MERRKASDYPPEVLKLFDGYVHGWMSRRDFLDKASKYAVGGFSAAAMLESLRPNYAFAQQVAKNDPRIVTEYLTYPSPQGSGTMKGYFAPAGRRGQMAGRRGDPRESRPQSVHRGCRAAPRDRRFRGVRAGRAHAARRLSGRRREGGADVRHARSPPSAIEDLVAACGLPQVAPRMQRQGRRGRILLRRHRSSISMAVRFPDLGAAVPFYGGQPSAADAAKIKAPLLLQYAGLDERINAGWPAYEAALKANNVKYQAFVYPEHQPRLPQRHDAALRRGRRQARVVAHDRLLQGKPEES